MNEYINRIKELSITNINSHLDDHKKDYIPPDLKEGSYRWFLYFYSNMYNDENNFISDKDKEMFIKISLKFRTEHLINWTRNSLIPLDTDKIDKVKKITENILKETNNFIVLKICIYLKRIILEEWYFIDEYILKYLPFLKEYIREK